jgi:hypothetical protein
VDVGFIFEPSDQREFSLFSSCFARGFFVMHMSCSMKCVCDNSSDFGRRSFARDFLCIDFYLLL